MELQKAKEVAKKVCEKLEEYCDKIEVVGSIRCEVGRVNGIIG